MQKAALRRRRLFTSRIIAIFYTNRGAITRDSTLINLIRMFSEGPAVSLRPRLLRDRWFRASIICRQNDGISNLIKNLGHFLGIKSKTLNNYIKLHNVPIL